MIDPHVHLRDWAQSDKETILHGLKAAKDAGFTHVFDMPNTSPALTHRDVIVARLSDGLEAAKTLKGISYHVYAGLTADEAQIREAVSAYNELFPLVIGLKLFAGQSTGNMGIVDKASQKSVFKVLSDANYSGVLAVHAEKESLLRPELYSPGHFETHSLARPAEAEIESVKDLLEISEEAGFNGTLHIAHVSTKGAVELIRDAKRKGRHVTMGVTPHHALLTSENAKDSSLFLKMNPPLRCEEDRDAVFSALLDGTADWAESDHAPHSIEDKEKGASGIPGFLGMLLLLDNLRKAGADEDRLKDLFALNAARAFSLEEDDVILPKNIRKRLFRLEGEYPFNPYKGLY